MAENESDGRCAACRAGDHSNHVPALAGICIGCTCEEASR